ncbi:hypothetical protein MTO96_013760 [Rhipicephalus appendiculatus]
MSEENTGVNSANLLSSSLDIQATPTAENPAGPSITPEHMSEENIGVYSADLLSSLDTGVMPAAENPARLSMTPEHMSEENIGVNSANLLSSSLDIGVMPTTENPARPSITPEHMSKENTGVNSANLLSSSLDMESIPTAGNPARPSITPVPMSEENTGVNSANLLSSSLDLNIVPTVEMPVRSSIRSEAMPAKKEAASTGRLSSPISSPKRLSTPSVRFNEPRPEGFCSDYPHEVQQGEVQNADYANPKQRIRLPSSPRAGTLKNCSSSLGSKLGASASPSELSAEAKCALSLPQMEFNSPSPSRIARPQLRTPSPRQDAPVAATTTGSLPQQLGLPRLSRIPMPRFKK